MFSKESLHHAYFIEGDKKSVLGELDSFMIEAFGIKRQGNPDVHYSEHDSFGIDEGRSLQQMQSFKPINGDRKIFIICTSTITSEAQNSLLKVFEEPTPGTHFFIISSSQRILLPTLRSRMAVVIHSSANKNFALGDAKKFLPMSPRYRLEFVSPMIEEKDRAKAEEFIQALLSEIHRTGKLSSAKELIRLAKWLRDRSSSLKLILERVALMDY